MRCGGDCTCEESKEEVAGRMNEADNGRGKRRRKLLTEESQKWKYQRIPGRVRKEVEREKMR